MPKELYIGLMSGTSIDGIDAGLVEFKDDQIRLLAFEYHPFSETERKQIQQLSLANTPVLLKDFAVVDTLVANLSHLACRNLLNKAHIPCSAIAAIGSHGQTIYHEPTSYSLQIGDPNIIAEKTGITTVADFRRRDISAGGQGAPLVPAFHQAFFSQTSNLKKNICIVNIGGIANITVLSSNKTIGFDTGPGNTLMDYWIKKNIGEPYDKNGNWAKEGTVNHELVNHLKQDLYFNLTPPKSTGKEYFSPAWLNQMLTHHSHINAIDVQSSLCLLTAETIIEAIHHYAPKTEQTIICGGGIHNSHLVKLIRSGLTHPVSSTAEFGINPDHVEAMAFAWLARQTMHNLSGNLIDVTGANTPVILGGIYPGKNGLGNTQ